MIEKINSAYYFSTYIDIVTTIYIDIEVVFNISNILFLQAIKLNVLPLKHSELAQIYRLIQGEYEKKRTKR